MLFVTRQTVYYINYTTLYYTILYYTNYTIFTVISGSSNSINSAQEPGQKYLILVEKEKHYQLFSW